MGVKDLLEAKFIALCNDLDPSLKTDVWERSKASTAFSFSRDENRSLEVSLQWDELIDLISDRSKLDAYLDETLSDDVKDIDDDDDEDPFSSGELVFDSDGRVHFASDLPD